MVLEVDILYAPAPVQESRDERPYYPRMYIAIDANKGFIMDYKIYRDRKEDKEDIDVMLNRLINMFFDGGLSRERRVRSELTASNSKGFMQEDRDKIKDYWYIACCGLFHHQENGRKFF